MWFLFVIITIVLSLLIYEVHSVHHVVTLEIVKNKKLVEENNALRSEVEDRNSRVEELNEAIKEGYGISTEVNTTVVDLEFEPYERGVMINALDTAIAESNSVEAVRSYLSLLDKLVVIFTKADNAGNRKKDD